MSSPHDIPLLFEQAKQLLQRGQLVPAENILKDVVARQPQHAEALHLLGVVCHQKGEHSAAENLIRRAIKRAPQFVAAHNNLGIVLKAQGKLKQAKSVYQALLKLKPDYPEALKNLAVVLSELGDTDAAIGAAKKALKLAPDNPELIYTLGTLHVMANQALEACEHFSRVLALQPSHVQAANNLGCALARRGEDEDAIDAFSKALEFAPSHAEALYNRAKSRQNCFQYRAAKEDFQAALKLQPDNLEFRFGLAWSMQNAGHFDEAIRGYQEVLDLDPAHKNALGNLLMVLNYQTGLSPAEVKDEHRRRIDAFLSTKKPALLAKHKAKKDCQPVRVGYISADFREHSVAYFLLPLLAHHDPEKFEVYCYYNNTYSDQMTEQLRQYASQWTEIYDLSDQAVARRIQKDRIDVLVDLSGHTADSRVLMFAHRPAPVQITWLGYPNTSGLEAMDFRIVDSVTDPQGLAETWSTEALLRMEKGFLCYAGREEVTAAERPPSLTKGHITFGSFNNLLKMNDLVFDSWARILQRVEGARLLIKNKQLDDQEIAEGVREALRSRGIEDSRVELKGKIKAKEGHLSLYNEVDIALDTFPYNGTTTTMEALWMGVPCVAYTGDRHAARVSASILRHAGLDELLADDQEGYENLAVALANDAERLKVLRLGFRERLKASPVCDAPAFARAMEKLYKQALVLKADA